ncbi:MAG: chemotaxis protein CheY [Conexibacter sp.]|nr:chemotaxis protein CheY [Conexibacter sp.]
MSVELRARMAILEDSDEDFEAVRRALAGPGDGRGLLRFRDAEELWAHLDGVPAGAEWPLLLLVDLGLSTDSGMDVLATLKAHPAWRLLPVVVLSGSSRQEDVDGAYRRGANAYIVKPLAFQELRDALWALQDLWAAVALPSPPALPRLDGSLLS